jgi:hypothetical protein
MEKEMIKSSKGGEDDMREPYYGSTIVVWIKPKPGMFCEFIITVGDAKKSIMVPSNFYQDFMVVISMIADKIQNANKNC